MRVSTPARRARLVVLVSGTGTNLQALLDATADPAYGAEVVAVGADREDIEGLVRAEKAGVPTFVNKVEEFSTREHWDREMAQTVASFEPDLVISAGFMKLAGKAFLAEFEGRYLNTHPALCPAFPGTHGARDAIEYGVKVTGGTLFVVDEGVDTGPIVAQASYRSRRTTPRPRCTSGSRSPSGSCSSTPSAGWPARASPSADRKVRFGQ